MTTLIPSPPPEPSADEVDPESLARDFGDHSGLWCPQRVEVDDSIASDVACLVHLHPADEGDSPRVDEAGVVARLSVEAGVFAASGEPDLALRCDVGREAVPCGAGDYPVTITLAPGIAGTGVIVAASFPDREDFVAVAISASGRPVPYMVRVSGGELYDNTGRRVQPTMAACPSASNPEVDVLWEGHRLLVTDDDACPDSVRLVTERGEDAGGFAAST